MYPIWPAMTCCRRQKLLTSLIALLTGVVVLGKEPTFDTPLANSSTELGSTALLPCAIDYLGKYKVLFTCPNELVSFSVKRIHAVHVCAVADHYVSI